MPWERRTALRRLLLGAQPFRVLIRFPNILSPRPPNREQVTKGTTGRITQAAGCPRLASHFRFPGWIPRGRTPCGSLLQVPDWIGQGMSSAAEGPIRMAANGAHGRAMAAVLEHTPHTRRRYPKPHPIAFCAPARTLASHLLPWLHPKAPGQPHSSMAEEPSSFSTRWSVIAQLHDGQPNDSWDWFIRRYRGYVSAVLRHLGFRAEEIGAATEEFWGYLYRSRAVERADRDGRFRAFLSGVVRNYARSWRRDQAPRDQPASAPAKPANLDELPDLRPTLELDLWAAQILHLGLARLGRDHADDEQALRWFYGLPCEVGGETNARVRATEIAQRLGCTANAMHQSLFRARNRLRECIEMEVSTTVGSSPDLREELGLLIGAVGRARPGLLDADAGAP